MKYSETYADTIQDIFHLEFQHNHYIVPREPLSGEDAVLLYNKLISVEGPISPDYERLRVSHALSVSFETRTEMSEVLELLKGIPEDPNLFPFTINPEALETVLNKVSRCYIASQQDTKALHTFFLNYYVKKVLPQYEGFIGQTDMKVVEPWLLLSQHFGDEQP